ncbi:hypothetical protein [Vulgatibacter incomptus]|uniref:Aminoglycoside phosphotransferase domain-containing protein n=1 Tax=Vulgatibacter incomptus TaxID=1391653 RepID=A0A0K1P9J2_9BACT|nr:hypothetical protein [Vulgatibacter incomptus]AKU90096.1 hypothetical protein AKJ08_0483 [Vulgatibacter incomptus]
MNDAEVVPPLPGVGIPPDQLWPGPEAVPILACARSSPHRPRWDLVGRRGKEDGSGGTDVFVVEAEGWCLKTSMRRRFPKRHDAQEAMRVLGDSKRRLGAWMPSHSALAVSEGHGGDWWLWTICPWLTTLRTRMTAAESLGDEAALGAVLGVYAEAATASLRMALAQHVVLDVHPSNFGFGGPALHYLDDHIAVGSSLPGIGHALLQRIEEYAELPGAIVRYLALLERALLTLSPIERAQIGLAEAFEQTLAQSEGAQRAKERLVRFSSRNAR